MINGLKLIINRPLIVDRQTRFVAAAEIRPVTISQGRCLPIMLTHKIVSIDLTPLRSH